MNKEQKREYSKLKMREYRARKKAAGEPTYNDTRTWEIRRDERLRLKYGINLDEYNEMLENQNYCCGICKKHKDNFTKNLYVDHCHDTGKVRGLLCQKCNSGLGLLGDNTDSIKNVLTYLDSGVK